MLSINDHRMLIQLVLGLLLVQVVMLAQAENAAKASGDDQATTLTLEKNGLDIEPPPAISTIKSQVGKRKFVAPEIRPDYTSRSIMAVGRIKSIDSATSTVVVEIDREKSSLPHILLVQASKAGLEDQVIERELPKQRAFELSRRTLFFDARPATNKEPVRADTGQIKTDPFLINFGEFAPGQWVSVLYRMRMDTSKPPIVFNISKVDPEKNSFRVDFNPLGKKKQFSRSDKDSKIGKPTGEEPQKGGDASKNSDKGPSTP